MHLNSIMAHTSLTRVEKTKFAHSTSAGLQLLWFLDCSPQALHFQVALFPDDDA